MRRVVLGRRHASADGGAVPLLGTLKHALFERLALGLDGGGGAARGPAPGPRGGGAAEPSAALRWPAGQAEGALCQIVASHRAELLSAGLAEAEAMAELRAALPTLQAWLCAYLPAFESAPRALLPLSALGGGGLDGCRLALVRPICAELELSSIALGLKGKVDLVVDAALQLPPPTQPAPGCAPMLRVPLPLELKTGKNASDALQQRHGAQAAAYALLLSEQLGTPVPAAALAYPAAQPPAALHATPAHAAAAAAATRGAPGLSSAVRAPRQHALHLMHCRNALASHLRPPEQRPRLPPMLRSEAACGRCSMAGPCMLAHLQQEGGDADSSGAPLAFEAHTRALAASPRLRAYLDEATALVDVEQAHEVGAPPAAVWLRHGPALELAGAARDAAEPSAGAAGGAGDGRKPARAPLVLGALEALDQSVALEQPRADAAPPCARGDGEGARAPAALGGRARERHLLRLRRAPDCPAELAGRALDGSTVDGRCFGPGESVRISLEPRPQRARLRGAGGAQPAAAAVRARYGVGCATIVRISATELTLALEAPLQPLAEAGAAGCAQPAAGCEWRRAWWVRLDALVGTRLFSTQRANLAWLAASEEPLAARLRELIVHGKPPAFEPAEPAEPRAAPDDAPHAAADTAPPAGGGGAADVAPVLSALRADRSLTAEQLAAACACARARDYAVVQGVPGAGKSCLIAALVKALAASGQRVLVAANAHAALDHILRKLGPGSAREGCAPPFIRVGPAGRAHADTRGCSLDALLEAAHAEHAAATVAGARIFGATVQSCSHGALRAVAPFDVAVVDEAGQLSQPALLGVLRLARRFVLVGDHYQLPPLLHAAPSAAPAAAAAEPAGAVCAGGGGARGSLMERLADAHPQAVAVLRTQWRMNAEIMSVPNALIYGGMLLAGSEAVARRALRLREGALGALGGGRAEWAWARAALDPERPVAVCDSDAANAGAAGVHTAGGTTNEAEARVALALTACLLRLGVAAADIALISPYRAQLKRLRELLDSAGAGCGGALQGPAEGGLGGQLRAVDVLTIDQSQGQDRVRAAGGRLGAPSRRAAGAREPQRGPDMFPPLCSPLCARSPA